METCLSLTGTGIPFDSYTTYTTASSLTVNGTHFSYRNSSDADKEVGNQLTKLGTFGGTGTLMPLSSISVKSLMILGMIVLGIYLKIGARSHGDKLNT